MIGPAGSRNSAQTVAPAAPAASALSASQSRRGMVTALTAEGIQVSIQGRLLRLSGALALAPGTLVTLERSPSGSSDVVQLRVADGPPIAARIATEADPATLPARSSALVTATLVTASGSVTSVDVIIAPVLDTAPPLKTRVADFLRGEPVTGVPDDAAVLALDDAALRLPLQSRELPASTPVIVRLLPPSSSIAAHASTIVDLPRLPHDATLAARLELLVSAAVSTTNAPVPLALLGLPGAAAVISFAIEPDAHPDHGRAEDQPKVVALEVDYPRLGRVRVVVRASNGRIDLVLRSERTLAPMVRGEISQLVEAAGAAGGLRASTGFATLSHGGS